MLPSKVEPLDGSRHSKKQKGTYLLLSTGGGGYKVIQVGGYKVRQMGGYKVSLSVDFRIWGLIRSNRYFFVPVNA